MRPATMTVRVADAPEIRRLLETFRAEHIALHAYLAAKLLHTEDGRVYSDLLVAHDAVADLWPAEDNEMSEAVGEATHPEHSKRVSCEVVDLLRELVEKVERLEDPPIPDGYEWAGGNNWRNGWNAAIQGVVLLIRNAR